jgi:diguanylate cyclase (GGDEF)-like protein
VIVADNSSVITVQRPLLVRVALVLLTVWAAGSEASAILPSHPGTGILFTGWAPEIAQLLSAALCLALAARVSGRARLAWALLGAAIVVWTAGDLYWLLVLDAKESVPVPSPADLGYLLFPVFAFVGLLVLLHTHVRDVPRTVLVDCAIVALSAATVSAAFVVQPVAHTASGGLPEVVTNLLYPVTDAALLSVVLAAFALRGWRLDATWLLLGAGTIMFFIADSCYLVENAHGTYEAPTLYDTGWSASAVLFATAAWAPARRAVERAAGMRDIVIPLAFAAVAIVVTFLQPPDGEHLATLVLGAGCVAAVMLRLGMTFRQNIALINASRHEASTDALTGLGNRRALAAALRRHLDTATELDPTLLVMFDLDGFKGYNDTFGHPAGDALLMRLGARLTAGVAGAGSAYRMGGDEFCALLAPGQGDAAAMIERAAAALTEQGDGFVIGSSYGIVRLPLEAVDPEAAMRLVDQRMYEAKSSGRASAGRQSKEVLLRAMAERNANLGGQMETVAELAELVARALGLEKAEVAEIRDAAALHDIGKVAIPDAILDKRGPLDDQELAFVQEHPLIGERIIGAAPALRGAAALVRSSHERFDGLGYPDRLRGDSIPLGARIIAVCDTFSAMVGDSRYRDPVAPEAALAELRGCAGTQFDPDVVAVFCAQWTARANLQSTAA